MWSPAWALAALLAPHAQVRQGMVRATVDGAVVHLAVEQKGAWIPYASLAPRDLGFSSTQVLVTSLDDRLTLRAGDEQLEISTQAGRPGLRFRLKLNLDRARAEIPVFGVQLSQKPDVVVEQGPMSIYGGNDYGAGFPAAYSWTSGIESAIFFDMTPMTWYGTATPRRFLDSRVVASGVDRSFLGLESFAGHPVQIGPGEVDVEWQFVVRANARRPSKIEGLSRTVEMLAPLHPAEAKIPPTRIESYSSDWETYAEQSLKMLGRPEASHEIVRHWDDGPLALVSPFEKMLTHPAHLRESGSDFSTTNNHLSPWLLFAQLHSEKPDLMRTGLRKRDALPGYFNSEAEIIGWNPYGEGDLAMSWQTLWFAIETLRASDASLADSFDPAVAGRFLMGLDGLKEVAEKSHYAFPQWWNTKTKLGVTQNDVPELGTVFEPWQAGQYAYLMLRGYEFTGDRARLDEARRAVKALFTSVDFTVENKRYSRHYRDPADFPITELLGNAYGAVACYKLAELTKQPLYRDYARYFLATLLRLTPWYEDEVGELAQQLHSLGLFYPHGGAYNLCPWETTEANLCIAWVLGHVPDPPYRELLLKLSNLNRVNSFYFFPATWTEKILDHSGRDAWRDTPFAPIEPFYTYEAPGGHAGASSLYAPTALWNWWLYDGLAEFSNPEVMALNLTSLEDFAPAIEGIERRFLLFNPGVGTVSGKLAIKELPDGDYSLERRTAKGWKEIGRGADSELEAGTSVSLAAGEAMEVRLRSTSYPARTAASNARKKASDALATAYAWLHRMPETDAKKLVPQFRGAVADYGRRRWDDSLRRSRSIRGK